MYTSLPQISKNSLDHRFNSHSYENVNLLKVEEGNSVKYRLKSSIEELSPSQSEELLDRRYVYFEPFGKPLNDAQKLFDFRNVLMEVAGKFGFPHELKSNSVRQFDQELSRTLWIAGSELGLTVSNASLQDTWNYLQGILLVDIVAWRWLDYKSMTFNAERITRLSRGALSNLWWKYFILTDNGRHEYENWMDLLTQDDIVQIIERPKMRGYTAIVIPFARKIAHLRNNGSSSQSAEELKRLIRAAAIRLRIYVSVKNPWMLQNKDENMDSVVDEIFRDAQRMLT